MVTPSLRCWCAAFKGELNFSYISFTERDCRRRVIDAGFASEDEAKRSHVWPLLQSRCGGSNDPVPHPHPKDRGEAPRRLALWSRQEAQFDNISEGWWVTLEGGLSICVGQRKPESIREGEVLIRMDMV